jgi:anti-sigma regulatory factor (Ser/Thr protein kinase)
MRQMLVVGPFPWQAIGVAPEDWKNVHIDESFGEADALRRLRAKAYDVIITSPVTPAARDLAMVIEAREQQPGIRTIVIAPELTAADIITALRNEVFSSFAMPVSPDELREAVAQALDADQWKNGIEVISALPDWITLRVACRRISADRMTRYVTELASAGDVENPHRHDLATAFREVLLNAMEHGAGFDPGKVIEVAAVRTARTIVYYFKDPGLGFNPKAPGLVATEDDPLSHLTYREAEGKRAGGFGMLLTSKLVDEVHYNERGNEVFLVKHLDKLKEKKVPAPRITGKKRVLPFGSPKARKA